MAETPLVNVSTCHVWPEAYERIWLNLTVVLRDRSLITDKGGLQIEKSQV